MDCMIKSPFWDRYLKLVREQLIPYQWGILTDRIPCETESHAVRNFQIAAGVKEGEFSGFVFQDSDLYKWIEAVGDILQYGRDEDLEQKADEIIGYIVSAQQEDGYLNTYYQLKEPDRKWTNLLECHELYCAGHLIEAAVAYHKGTGKDGLLKAACRLADCVDRTFGPEEGKLHGYPGHQEIELALLKLYDVTGEERYLNLSSYFLEARGNNRFFEEEFERRGRISHWTRGQVDEPNREYNQYPYAYYNQFHIPVRQQKKAVGHAVRAVYMYAAMARMAGCCRDEKLLDTCRELWKNITGTQMYITGSIGSTPSGEAFTRAYDLPNDTNYSETCASVGLIRFAMEMLLNEADSSYADVIEKALYNTVLSGLSLDGRHFFYVNPLEAVPEVCEANPERHHVKTVRQAWYACACCPPNIARTIADLQSLIYSVDGERFYVHQYIGREREVTLPSGTFRLIQESELPWKGRSVFRFESENPVSGELALRIPQWCVRYSLTMNQHSVTDFSVERGYLVVKREWKDGDVLEWVLEMEPSFCQADQRIFYDAGKAALIRGPLVYCLEEADNGPYLHECRVDVQGKPELYWEETLGGYYGITVPGVRYSGRRQECLYEKAFVEKQAVKLKAVPYFLWNNRGEGEMITWIDIM